MTATQSHTAQRILAALATCPVQGIADLRALLGNPADFRSAVLALESECRVILCCDVEPSAIGPERRKLLLEEGGIVFTTIMGR